MWSVCLLNGKPGFAALLIAWLMLLSQHEPLFSLEIWQWLKKRLPVVIGKMLYACLSAWSQIWLCSLKGSQRYFPALQYYNFTFMGANQLAFSLSSRSIMTKNYSFWVPKAESKILKNYSFFFFWPCSQNQRYSELFECSARHINRPFQATKHALLSELIWEGEVPSI